MKGSLVHPFFKNWQRKFIRISFSTARTGKEILKDFVFKSSSAFQELDKRV